MRLLFTFGGLLVVLAVIALSARHQLEANRRFLPAAGGVSGVGAASGTSGGSPQVTPAQYQRQIEQALRDGAQQGADRAASAGADDAK
jgi:hypothetical protein